MRDKLNNSPAAQIGLIAILVVAAFVLLVKPGGGGGSSSEAGTEPGATEATVSVAGTSATGTATGATPGEAVEGAVEGALESAAEAPVTAIPTALPVAPLPAPVASAYDAGETVALLVVHGGDIDNRLVAGAVAGLAGRPGVRLFVVPARRIARYAAITLGSGVQEVPALLVMRPKRLSGGVPQASVAYGFQTPQSIVQAVRDASYNGPEASYHPN